MTTHSHTNKLIDETSPYLLQHAHNPVDWYPWGLDPGPDYRNPKHLGQTTQSQ